MTTWLYNIYHGSVLSEDKVVIDSNAKAKSRIEAARRKAEEERRREDKEVIDSFIASLSKDDSGLPVLEKDSDGNYVIPFGDDGKPLFEADDNGHPVISEPEEQDEEAFEEQPSTKEFDEEREQILSEARADADAIIAKAKEEADGIFEHTADEASKKGYSDGLLKGQEEYQAKLFALDTRQASLEDNYKQKEASLEKEVLDAVLEVVSKAFDIEYSDDGDLLLTQVDNCLNHVENSKDILIRVNDRNYSLLQTKKDEITGRLGEGVSVEFAKDPLLSDGQGMIETDGGVYDVSIDTEFKNLIKRIRLLSI